MPASQVSRTQESEHYLEKKPYGVSPGIQDSFHVKMVCDRVEAPFISWNWKIHGMLGRILSYFTILAFINPHLLIVVTL